LALVNYRKTSLEINRTEYDFKHSKKGTVQHDSLFGNRADAYSDGTNLEIKVSCKQDASGLKKASKIKFGLAVTLEILNNNTIAIYDEIKTRIQTEIQVPT